MSKFTNTHKVPEYIFHAGSSLNYKPAKDRMSVTHLTGAPLPRTLLIKHFDEIEQDVSDMFWAIHGTSLDHLLKKHSRWGLTNIKLEHLFVNDGITLAGRPDYYGVLDKILADLKDTSIWNLKKARTEWIGQLNIYDWLLRTEVPQLVVDKLQVHAIGRDWRRGEALRYNDYPEIPFKVLDIPRWSYEEQTDYIDSQLKDHLLNPERECTPEEKWAKDDTFAVMKEGRKSALKVEDSLLNAHAWCEKKGHVEAEKGISIVKRPGDFVKCSSYCAVNKHCPYYKEK